MELSVSKRRKEEISSEPNVVPLCDVLLVLLIIFMVVTPLVQKGVDVTLPQALNTSSMPDSPDVVLAIKKDGTLFVNEQKVEKENLQNTLEEAFLTVSEKKLFIKADQDIEYGKIVDLIDVMREAGIEIIGIITDKKTERAL
jgi:biopolymer transport protein ExbD